MIIYYVRHGQSTDNVYDLITGRNDVALTEKGIEQAQVSAELLKDIDFDKCYCSPLIRAKQTLEKILKYHSNLKVVYDDRLLEREYGEASSRPSKDFTFNRWQMDTIFPVKGMETVNEILKRVTDFFDEIIKNNDCKKILIVAHGGLGRAVNCYFNGIPQSRDLSKIVTGNAEILIFDTEKITKMRDDDLKM